MYMFDVSWSGGSSPSVSTNITAFATRHTSTQSFRATVPNDLDWLLNTFNELSNPYGATATYDTASAIFQVRSIAYTQ